MNIQTVIQKLAQQTDVWCDQNYHNDQYYDIHWENKFAELIVKECAGLVQGVPTDTMGYHTADQKIKQHFGVE